MISPVSRISPSNKPALGRQRDHSGCRADTPLKVKKTRENLKQASAYVEITPPCLHVSYLHEGHGLHPAPQQSAIPASGHATAARVPTTDSRPLSNPPLLPEQQHHQIATHAQSKVERQKSVSRRMLSRVKQGIASKSKPSLSIRPTEDETSLVRRLSARRKHSNDVEQRSRSFELSRDSIDSTVDEVSASVRTLVQRSFTDSTVSTSEILDDLAAVRVPSFQGRYGDAGVDINLPTVRSFSPPAISKPSPQPTPRPPGQSIAPDSAKTLRSSSIALPCLDLDVKLDCNSADIGSKRDVWIAINASVRLQSTVLTGSAACPRFDGDAHANHLDTWRISNQHSHLRNCKGRDELTCGTITTLRLCYKPADGCRIRNVIGQRSYKDLTFGQQCTLFIKLGVPRLKPTNADGEPDQDDLFAELESMVGTLKTEILHIEARYRHSLLPADNIVALKHTCKILRPKTESRWSIIGSSEQEEDSADVHAHLAQYLADHYTTDEALELLHRWFDFDTRSRPGMAEVCSMLQNKINLQRSGVDDAQPEVVITDIDQNADSLPSPVMECYETAPTAPLDSKAAVHTPTTAHKQIGSSSSLMSSKLALPPIYASRTATGLTTSAFNSSPSSAQDGDESHDSAHQLWRHIRRASLSARHLAEMTPDRLSSLEAGDDSLRELRRRALVNKRSIGAETLRTWKWEEDMQAKEKPAEAPWM